MGTLVGEQSGGPGKDRQRSTRRVVTGLFRIKKGTRMSDSQHEQTQTWPDSLIDLLLCQEKVVGKLHDLAKYQGQLIESKSTDPLLGLLSQRQKLIDEFTLMQGELTRLTEGREDQLRDLDSPTRERIQSLIDEVGAILNRVMAKDDRDRRTLEAVKGKVQEELATTGAAQKARSAYRSTSIVGSQFSDQQG